MFRIQSLRCRSVGEAPLEDASLVVGRGELVAVCGPSGAGKSTLCRCIAGLRAPESGTIVLDGAPLPAVPWRVAKAGVSVLLKGRRVFPELTVAENLAVAPRAWADGPPRRRLDEVFAIFPALAGRRNQRGGTLSGGEQQMVAIGRAMLTRPRVLVLDEPTLGLAPRVVADVQRALLTIRASGVGLLVAEEDDERLAGVADRRYLMVHGRIHLSPPEQGSPPGSVDGEPSIGLPDGQGHEGADASEATGKEPLRRQIARIDDVY